MSRRYPLDKRKIVILLILFSVFACFSLIKRSSNDRGIPSDTYMVIHASTFTSSNTINPNARSYLYYYGKQGNLLGVSKEQEEVCGDFIVETKSGITCFYKNHSLVLSSGEESVQESNSNYKVHSTKFGPSELGYIPSLDISFALLNIGQKSKSEPYINVLRFVSQKLNYDVVIPYFISSVAYDPIQNHFVCEISPLMGTSSYLEYVIVRYDDNMRMFILDETIYRLENPEISKKYTKLISDFKVSDNNLVQVAIISNKVGTEENRGMVLLSTYDLATQSVIENQVLCAEYDLGIYGGVLVGSAHLPFVERKDILYFFTSNGRIYKVFSQEHVEIIEMQYDFTNTLHLSNPHYSEYNDRCNFTGVEVKVSDEGEIYVLSLHRDCTLKVHQLIDGAFKKIWEATLPDNLGEDLGINSFEIINQNYS